MPPRALAGVAALALAAAGCGTVPRAPRDADARARTMEVPQDRALVYVFREDALDGAYTLPLVANAVPIGDLPLDAYWVLDVPPGELRLEFPFGGGATRLRMRVEAGRRYFVRQAVRRWPMETVRVQTAKLVPVDERTGRAGLGRLVRVARVPAPGPG